MERAFGKATGQQIVSSGDEIPAPENQGAGQSGEGRIDENNPVLGTPAATSAAQVQDDPKELEVYNKFFEKKFGGKKEEEIQAALTRKPFEEEATDRFGRPIAEVDDYIKNPPKAVEFETDLLKSHQAFLKAGGTEADWRKSLVIQDRLGEMSHDELVKHGLKLKHPELTPEKINTFFKAQYKIPAELDPNNFSEEEVAERNEEIEMAKLRLEVDAEEIRKSELAKSVKALEEPVSRGTKKTPEQIAKEDADRKEAIALMTESKNKLTALKAIEVDIVEGEKGKEITAKVSYELTPEEKKVAENIIQTPEAFFWSMFTKEGKLDPGKFAETAALIAGGKRAIERMATDYAHVKLEAYIKGLNNANFKPGEMRLAPTSDEAKRNKELADKQMGRA